MEIYKLDVSHFEGDFDAVYDTLDNIGCKYSIYSGNFIFVSDKTIDDIKNEFKQVALEDNICVVKDIDSEIPNKNIANWAKLKLAEYYVKEAQKEVQERTNALFDILEEANNMTVEEIKADDTNKENIK